jgi:PleD family two-component response regulator
MARAKPSDTVEEWFQRADNALYRAKRAGRDRGQLAEASPEEPASA